MRGRGNDDRTPRLRGSGPGAGPVPLQRLRGRRACALGRPPARRRPLPGLRPDRPSPAPLPGAAVTRGLTRRLRDWAGARLQRRMVLALAAVLFVLSAVVLGVVSGLYRARLAAEMERASLQVSGLL